MVHVTEFCDIRTTLACKLGFDRNVQNWNHNLRSKWQGAQGAGETPRDGEMCVCVCVCPFLKLNFLTFHKPTQKGILSLRFRGKNCLFVWESDAQMPSHDWSLIPPPQKQPPPCKLLQVLPPERQNPLI